MRKRRRNRGIFFGSDIWQASFCLIPKSCDDVRMSLVGNIYVYRFGQEIPISRRDKLSVILFKGNLHAVDSLLLKYPSSRELFSYTCCLTFEAQKYFLHSRVP